MRRRRHRTSAGMWFAVAAGVLLVAVLAVRLPSSRLPRAVRVASTASWPPQDHGLPSNWPYFWLSDREILFFRRDRNGESNAYRLNMETGKETASGLWLPPGARCRLVSPDKQWLLWDSEARMAVASRLDGSKEVSWPSERVYTPLWLPGSQHWVQVVWKNGGPSLAVGALKTAQVTVIPLPVSRKLPYTQRRVGNTIGITESGLLYTSSPALITNGKTGLNGFIRDFDEARLLTSR